MVEKLSYKHQEPKMHVHDRDNACGMLIFMNTKNKKLLQCPPVSLFFCLWLQDFLRLEVLAWFQVSRMWKTSYNVKNTLS